MERERERGRKNEEEATIKTPGEHPPSGASSKKFRPFSPGPWDPWEPFSGAQSDNTRRRFLFCGRYDPSHGKTFHGIFATGISRLSRRNAADRHLYETRIVCEAKPRENGVPWHPVFIPLSKRHPRRTSSTDDLNPDLNLDMNNLWCAGRDAASLRNLEIFRAQATVLL